MNCRITTPQGTPRLGRIVDRREEASFGGGLEEICTVEVAGARFTVPATEVQPV